VEIITCNSGTESFLPTKVLKDRLEGVDRMNFTTMARKKLLHHHSDSEMQHPTNSEAKEDEYPLFYLKID
jgi:hypothetical protein